MVRRYVVSLFAVIVVLCAMSSSFSFVTHEHVKVGDVLNETYQADFVAHISGDDYYRIEGDFLEDFRRNTAFIGTGPVKIISSKVEVTTKTVKWRSNKTDYTAPGAGLVGHVQWKVDENAAEGAEGDISVKFPEFKRQDFGIQFHSGGFQRDGARTIFREVVAHRNAGGLFLGRMIFASSFALPLGVLLHGIWWLFVLKKEKRARVAAMTPENPEALPRTFYPSPVAEWYWFDLMMIIVGGIGVLIATISMLDGFVSSTMFYLIMGTMVFGVFLGLLVAWLVRRSLVTLKIDADAVSYAKGRGTPNWITARWADLKSAQRLTRVHKGVTHEWVELIFPDGKKRKFSENTVDEYKMVRDTVLTMFQHHHQPPPAPAVE